jgi:hypothetical protein
VSVALEVPLRDLTDVGDKHSTVPTEEAEKIFALVSGGGVQRTSARPTTSCARCSAAPRKLRQSPLLPAPGRDRPTIERHDEGMT